MFRVVLVGVTLFAGVLAGRSPHANLVDQFQNSPDSSRFSSDVFEDARLDIESLIRKYQYPFEAHNVVTSDGYILTAHRIPHGRDRNNQPGPRPAVLVLHGLLSSSADFVTLGPGNALSYFLAEEGYDVWLLNARGNTFSRNHTIMDPDRRGDAEFWMYSWDEIGSLDLPAYIDYILETTGQEKVHYIGHSQGGTSFLVMSASRPEYNEKIISFLGLAPAAYFHNNENTFFLVMSPYERVLDVSTISKKLILLYNFFLISLNMIQLLQSIHLPSYLGTRYFRTHVVTVFLQALASQLGIGEVLGQSDILSFITFNFCRDGALTQPLCLLLFVNDQNADYFNSTMLPVFLGHAPAGAAFRQVLHYAQSIKFGTFSRYNFGTLQNLYIYGRVTPPPYDMSRVTVRTNLHYGLNDVEAHWRDILFLSEILPNARAIQAPRPSFTHYDFIWGIDAKEQVYETAIEMMREAERPLIIK
ncbi:lipase 1-like [Choristoneura fumiferana]|uniref:lipase 1-like n=1 Tax=Choristoneura fumiferana TaxID=7141 RepID=UPI003D15A35F